MSEAAMIDAKTIDAWRREHERVIESSESGSYSEHVSRQLLMVLDDLDAARAELAQHAALVAAAREWKQQGEAHGYSSIEAAMAKGKLIDAALAVQPHASVARGEEGE